MKASFPQHDIARPCVPSCQIFYPPDNCGGPIICQLIARGHSDVDKVCAAGLKGVSRVFTQLLRKTRGTFCRAATYLPSPNGVAIYHIQCSSPYSHRSPATKLQSRGSNYYAGQSVVGRRCLATIDMYKSM